MKGPRIIVLLCTVVVMATQAHADIFQTEFYNITDNGWPDVGDQLIMQVISDDDPAFLGDPGQVQFNLLNLGPLGSTIGAVYWDDGVLSGIAGLIDADDPLGGPFGHPGVDFSPGGSPGDLPGGNELTPPFIATFWVTHDGLSIAPGVDPGEGLGVLFDLQIGGTYDDVVSDILSGDLRVGLHVQRLGDNAQGSDSYVNVVPLPGAVLLGLLGLAAAGRKLRQLC